ncbi:hypothetical protein GGH99_007844 [Coemansia sp. RSA 1285]|nr:hypothetical protein GGH99_007844 [Coemansia sp. RSA 1285]
MWTNEDYLLESLAASLQNTPHLQFTTSGFSSATNVFAGLNLPDSLLATTSNEASNGNNGHGNGNNNQPLADFTIPEPSKGTQKQGTRTLHQLNDIQPITATPASLLNLPASAHHLPHTSTGEIVNPQSIASLPQQQQHQPMGSSTAEQHALPVFLMHSAPMPSEFLHPPAPPPLQIEEASIIATTADNANGKNDNSSGIKKRGGRRKSMTATTDKLQQQQQTVGNKVATKPRRNEATRRRSRQALLSPRTTPLVPSTLKAGTSPGISPALAPLTPSVAGNSNSNASSSSSGGGGKEHATTPQLRPARGGAVVIAATSTTNIVGLEADVVTRLATKSNYQNIMEGKSELLGLNYRSEFKSGLEKRRTNHKQAEQKRRDSLKMCFQDLHHRLPNVDPKMVSKIYLLNKANGYIDALRRANERIALAAKEKGVDVEAIMADAFVDDDFGRQEEEDEEEQEEEEEEVEEKGN